MMTTESVAPKTPASTNGGPAAAPVDVAATVDRLRKTFATGRTRDIEWRKNQLLQLQEDQVRAKKESFRKDAIDTINCLIAMFGFKPSDLDFEGTYTPKILKGTRGRKTKTAVADKPKRTIKPKYVTPDGACTWTGRGKMPVKMRELVDAGTPLESMLIEKTPAEQL